LPWSFFGVPRSGARWQEFRQASQNRS
jgi:hypothetical protein